MLTITLPDKSNHSIEQGTKITDFLQNLNPSLAKKTIAYTLDGVLHDIRDPITQSGDLQAVVADSALGIEIIKHDTAHLLAYALSELFPNIQFGFGPAIENGFYYDVLCEETISQDDFPKIEQKMQECTRANVPITKKVLSKNDALDFFTSHHQPFKVEAIEKFSPQTTITTYTEGSFVDLCRGPHTLSSGFIKTHFKLTKISGSYWLGNQDNVQMQRIYGIVFLEKKQLSDYLFFLKEAKKRDHRVLGQVMDLFHLQPESPGSAFFHPKGKILLETLRTYMQKKWQKYECQEITTPSILSKSFWEMSGHWDKFHEEMFIIETDQHNHQKEVYALKPMSCPGHIQIFNHNTVSYKQLPIRYAEFGSCVRNEPSGALYGIMRVRSFLQDDTHIFCTKEQVQQEIITSCLMLHEVYQDFGFNNYDVLISTRPEKRIGTDALWDQAEQVLEESVKQAGMKATINPGEGAFYGPKLEFILTDTLNRKWQCGTVQLDYFLPQRLSAYYINSDGQKEHPVMIHRAIFGSMERFMGILLEHYGGQMPLWIAPTQIALLTITSDCENYGQELYKKFSQHYHTIQDFSNNQISYKIRQHTMEKVPVLAIIGKKEMNERKITLRFANGAAQQTLEISEAIDILKTL